MVHVYLAPELLSRVSSEAMDREVADVRLEYVLRTRDPVIASVAGAIAAETEQQGVGGRLYVEALATQMAVHLLRRYSAISYRQCACAGALSPQANASSAHASGVRHTRT